MLKNILHYVLILRYWKFMGNIMLIHVNSPYMRVIIDEYSDVIQYLVAYPIVKLLNNTSGDHIVEECRIFH